MRRVLLAVAWGLGYVWALPLTILGVLQALVGGARPLAWDRGVWYWTARQSGICAWFFRRYRMAAYTWGAVITWADPVLATSRRLRLHERRHVWQCMVLGPLIVPAYLVCLACYGYQRNPLEVDARAHEMDPGPQP